MRSLTFLALAAMLVTSGGAVAQAPDEAPKAPDPAQSRAVDEAYRARCEAKVSKELCACVIGVGDAEIVDPQERAVFFDYMMGDVDKAKAVRAQFSPRKSMEFGVQLQKADAMLGQQCDRLKPPEPAQPTGEAAPKPN